MQQLAKHANQSNKWDLSRLIKSVAQRPSIVKLVWLSSEVFLLEEQEPRRQSTEADSSIFSNRRNKILIEN